MLPRVEVLVKSPSVEDTLRAELAATRADLARAVPAWQIGTPPADGPYLAVVAGEVHTMWWLDGEWSWCWTHVVSHSVTHWMPVPALPEAT